MCTCYKIVLYGPLPRPPVKVGVSPSVSECLRVSVARWGGVVNLQDKKRTKTMSERDVRESISRVLAPRVHSREVAPTDAVDIEAATAHEVCSLQHFEAQQSNTYANALLCCINARGRLVVAGAETNAPRASFAPR